MNELEKLREEMEDRLRNMTNDLLQFEEKMHGHIYDFRVVMNRAREIERQAGIGSDTNA